MNERRRMPMKKGSFIRNLSIMLFAQLILLTVLFVVLVANMRNTATAEMETAADNMLSIYSVNLENRIERADNILKNLTLSEETSLELIRSDSESDRYYAKKTIYTAMHSALVQDNAVDLLIVAENQYNGYMESTNGDAAYGVLSYTMRRSIEAFTWELLNSNTRRNAWTIQKIGGEPFLYRAYMRNGRIVAAYISAEHFFTGSMDPAISNMSLVLTDEAGIAWQIVGNGLTGAEIGQAIPDQGHNWKVNQCRIGDSSLYMTGYLNESGMEFTTKNSVLALILIALVAVGCSLTIVYYTRRQIILPMRDMTEKLSEMNEKTEGFQIQTNYGSREFLLLRDTFNRMMRENVDLKLSAYKHQMDMQDTELRCIRLQLRPHFFLNAMTTISSLSMQGQNDNIKKYVDVLSKNIRYMFKSGMHTVPLAAEMQNVQYYYEMQELRYPNSAFYCSEHDNEDDNWPIPQMLIHTVVENIYKHTVSVDSMITILVQAKRCEYKGLPMLCISIEDDGEGYPREILAQFKAGKEPQQSKDGKHLGLWSLWTMLRLMYGRDDLMVLENAVPHGSKTVFYLPEKAVNEIGKTPV